MASTINRLNPVNTNPTVASVRANFAASANDIEALQHSYGTVETIGRTLTVADFNRTILYNSASAGVFTIPTDATLGLADATEAVFKVLQLGTGAVSIVAAGGVTNNKPTDIPPAIQFSTEVATRYGVSTYVGTRV